MAGPPVQYWQSGFAHPGVEDETRFLTRGHHHMDQSLLREAQARANELVEMTSISSQELLAYLALHAGHATARDLFDARDAGYELGSIGHGAHMLTDRVQNAITSYADQEPDHEASAADARSLGAHA